MLTPPAAIPFDRTATRPAYSTLPSHPRSRIEHHIGGPPATVALAGGGYTSGFAALITSSTGARIFIKAAGPDTPVYVDHYRTEARNLASLPARMPAPRLRFVDDEADWVILGIEAVPARPVTNPINPDDLTRMLDAWAQAADQLDPTPSVLAELGLSSDDMAYFRRWTAVAVGDEPMFPTPPKLAGRIDTLADLECDLSAAVASTAATHNDLRPDNMLIGDHQAWICDWNHMTLRAPWFDTVAFLTAIGPGHNREARFWTHSTASGVTDEQLDAVLASLSGFFAAESTRPAPPGASSYIRRYQATCALAAADWLADRRGW